MSLGQHGLQILEVSWDLEMVDVNVVETPWKYPYGKKGFLYVALS
jgi:hypothetical protein